MRTDKQLNNELQQLRERLAEAEATIAAIRNGEVDALVVSNGDADQIFTLHGADQPYRLFVESMQQGALTVASDGTIFYANQRLAEMMGLPLQRVIGSSLMSLISASDGPHVGRLLEQGGTGQQRVLMQQESGSLFPAQLAFVPQNTSNTPTVCVVVTDLTDVQERQILTEALERLRTAQQQLRQQNHDLHEARQAAEAASTAKDTFLAQLSHELRTPLTPVMMALGDLDGASLPRLVTEELNLIRRNIELQVSLIDDLLDLSRVVTGKLSLSPIALDLHALINDVVRSCASESSLKHQDIKVELLAAEATVSGDPVRLRQVFWNILRNAVKFTPAGGSIAIRTESRDGRVCATIEDTGIGISSDALARIFSPFEQASQNINRRFGGLGLGLAITQRLVQMHGGTVVASSEGEGSGSTFRVELPLITAAAAAIMPPRPAAEMTGLRGRILLVEDHEDTRVLLARLLSERHDVVGAATVKAAVEAVNAREFDLLISDLGLPDGSGYDVIAKVRERRQIPSIALSGFGADSDVERSLKAGFRRHLVKPVTLRDLFAAIDETLLAPADEAGESR